MRLGRLNLNGTHEAKAAKHRARLWVFNCSAGFSVFVGPSDRSVSREAAVLLLAPMPCESLGSRGLLGGRVCT
ncbi:MAG: hypothetical protein M2R45_01001 [Verrucomicrobia subdivision 3 bacterium]|nr:hypothetical protein [Limisphaerales bacterium]MCS1414111.1 hypothetical protein [Limisphaerales bacterium]